MVARLLLCLLLPVVSMGCLELGTEDPNATSGGNTTGGTSGTCVTGANFMSLALSEESGTNGIVSDSSGIYWVNGLGTVWQAGPKGASPRPMASKVADQLYTIATDEEAVYVVNYATALHRIDKKTESVTTLATGSFVGLAVDATAVYLTGAGGVKRFDKQQMTVADFASISGADSLALDADYVYVRAQVANSMARTVRVSKKDLTLEDIASPEISDYHYFSQEIAVDTTHVYWVNPSAGSISRVLKTGGATELIISGLADPKSITLDEAFVYFTIRGKTGGSTEDRAVAKVPKAGGPITYIAHGSQVSAHAIAVDETNAYWTQKVTNGVVETACK